jgi:hypothetical protein
MRFRKLLHCLKSITNGFPGGSLGVHEVRNRTRKTLVCGLLRLSLFFAADFQCALGLSIWMPTWRHLTATLPSVRIAYCARLRPKSHLLSCTGVFRSKLHRELPGNEVAVDMPSSFSAASNLSGACGTHVWFRRHPLGRIRRARHSFCLKIVPSGKAVISRAQRAASQPQ